MFIYMLQKVWDCVSWSNNSNEEDLCEPRKECYDKVMIRLERANPGANLECFQYFGYANVSFV